MPSSARQEFENSATVPLSGRKRHSSAMSAQLHSPRTSPRVSRMLRVIDEVKSEVREDHVRVLFILPQLKSTVNPCILPRKLICFHSNQPTFQHVMSRLSMVDLPSALPFRDSRDDDDEAADAAAAEKLAKALGTTATEDGSENKREVNADETEEAEEAEGCPRCPSSLRAWAKAVATSIHFDRVMTIIILFNCITIVVDTSGITNLTWEERREEVRGLTNISLSEFTVLTQHYTL